MTVQRNLFRLAAMIFAAMLCLISMAQPQYVPSNPFMPGDVNEDKLIDIADVNGVINTMLGKSDLTDTQLRNADFNHDGTVDIADVNGVINLMLGKGYAHADPMSLVVETRDGSRDVFPLADKPQLSFSGSELLVESTHATSYYSRNQLYQIYYMPYSRANGLGKAQRAAVSENPNQFAVYIYRNDNDFNAHLNIDVESIRFSPVGTDSAWYDNALVQEIWTPDTVYRTPIAAVDSITFEAPKPILREGLFHITSDHVPYTMAVTDTTIVFNANMPATLWPAVGQTVIVDIGEEPYVKGACVIVDSLSTTGNEVTLHCYEAYLGDVFEKLVLVGKAVSTDDGTDQANGARGLRRKSLFGDWMDQHSSEYSAVVPVHIPDNINIKAASLFTFSSKSPDAVLNYSVFMDPLVYSVHGELMISHKNVSSSINFGCKDLFADKSTMDELAGYLDDFQNNWYELADAKAKEKLKDTKWYKKVMDGLVFKFPAIEGFIDVFVGMEKPFSGDAGIEVGQTGGKADQKLTFTVTGQRPYMAAVEGLKAFVPIVTINNKNSYFKMTDYGDFHAAAYIKGSMTLGVQAGVILKLFSERLISAKASVSGGLELSGKMELALEDLINQQESTWYNALKNTSVDADWFLKVGASANVLKMNTLSVSWDNKWKWPLVHFQSFPELTQPKMPTYDYVTGQWSSLEPMSFVMNPEKNILFGMPVGLQLINSNGMVIGSATSTENYRMHKDWKESNLNLPLLASYLPGTKMRVRPVLYGNFFGQEFTHEDASQDFVFTVPDPVSVPGNYYRVEQGKTITVPVNGGWGVYSIKATPKDVVQLSLSTWNTDMTAERNLIIQGETLGTTTVTVTDLRTGEKKDFSVNVTDETLGDLVLSTNSVEVNEGQTATVSFYAGSGQYEVESSTPTVATATLQGEGAQQEVLIQGIKQGIATIVVLDTQFDKVATISVTVTKNGDNPQTQTYTVNGVTFKMVAVEGGTFTMGATAEQGSDAWDREYPTHQVTLSSFAIGQTEVTQELWQAVMGNNPSYFTGDLQRPVEYVSWNKCQEFITKLNQLTGKNFRLPTEAEWEYAARGGNRSQGYKYAGSDNIDDVAWYDSNSSSTHPVATKSPNELGLYDMSGNVYECCQDWYGSYSSDAQTNPTGPASGSLRVLRGGCWEFSASYCRVSSRIYNAPTSRSRNVGLRLAL